MTLIADSQQRKFTDEDVQQAGMFAAHAAIAIENAGLFESLENANRELSLAYDETTRGGPARSIYATRRPKDIRCESHNWLSVWPR